MGSDERRAVPARQRLLETAGQLFYAEGINNVGVDRVVAEASVTKATFYRHFPSKEDLVVAYLESVDERFRAWFDQLSADHEDPRALLDAYFDGIAAHLCSQDFRGCHFINAAAEVARSDSRIAAAVRSHRTWFAASVVDTLARAEMPAHRSASEHLVMLRDGAMVEGYLDSAEAAAKTLRRSVRMLLDGTSHRP